MKYAEFSKIVSPERMNRYLLACHGDKRRAQQLYRYNNAASAALFSVIAYFEVALRNAIDQRMKAAHGADWLRDSAQPGGIFATNTRCTDTTSIINNALRTLTHRAAYTHCALVSELDFGNWRYMFSPSQYRATGQILLSVFPAKPRSTAAVQHNSTYVFNRLGEINRLRNRIAHHEPVCFLGPTATTANLRDAYTKMLQLLTWMGINPTDFLRHADKVEKHCQRLDALIATLNNPPK